MRRVLSILIALSLVIVLSICGCIKQGEDKASAKPAKKQIHVSVIGKSVNPYWSQVNAGVKKAARDLGIRADFFAPNKEDASQQVLALENIIARGVDGIALAPSDPASIAYVIQDAATRNIPTITLDTDAPETPRVVYIGTNNRAAGKIAGEKMVELLGGKGKIAIFTDSLTATNSLERLAGFKSALEGTEIEVVQTLVDNKDPSAALSQAEQILEIHPNLGGFFGVNAGNGSVAAQAMTNAGKAGQVKIICFGTPPDVIQFIKAGTIHATIVQRPFMMGYKSVEILNDIATGGMAAALAKLPANLIVDTGVDVITSQSLAKE